MARLNGMAQGETQANTTHGTMPLREGGHGRKQTEERKKQQCKCGRNSRGYSSVMWLCRIGNESKGALYTAAAGSGDMAAWTVPFDSASTISLALSLPLKIAPSMDAK